MSTDVWNNSADMEVTSGDGVLAVDLNRIVENHETIQNTFYSVFVKERYTITYSGSTAYMEPYVSAPYAFARAFFNSPDGASARAGINAEMYVFNAGASAYIAGSFIAGPMANRIVFQVKNNATVDSISYDLKFEGTSKVSGSVSAASTMTKVDYTGGAIPYTLDGSLVRFRLELTSINPSDNGPEILLAIGNEHNANMGSLAL